MTRNKIFLLAVTCFIAASYGCGNNVGKGELSINQRSIPNHQAPSSPPTEEQEKKTLTDLIKSILVESSKTFKKIKNQSNYSYTLTKKLKDDAGKAYDFLQKEINEKKDTGQIPDPVDFNIKSIKNDLISLLFPFYLVQFSDKKLNESSEGSKVEIRYGHDESSVFSQAVEKYFTAEEIENHESLKKFNIKH